ncbi:MAG: hypothetical protein WCK08_05130 [Betaproteobacteria bacterium]
MRIATLDRFAPHRERVQTDDIHVHKTTLLYSGPSEFPAPTAHLIEQAAGDVVRPHFHMNSQFQVFVHGKGWLGRKRIAPFVVQYVGPHTGYGPITTDGGDLWYLTLRPSYPTDQPGYKPVLYLPESRPVQDASARKFQVQSLVFAPRAAASTAVMPHAMIEPAAHGLAAWWMQLAPGETARPPQHPQGLARYCVVASGSLVQQGQVLPPLALIWSTCDEDVPMTAGAGGAEVMVLQFPADAT